MRQTPFEFCQQRKGELRFHRGIPFCLYRDRFGWNNYVFWDLSNQTGTLKIFSEAECVVLAIQSIDRHFESLLCAFCVETSLEQVRDDGRYRCLKCERIPAIYLWQWETDSLDSTEFLLCFNRPQWKPKELGVGS